MQPMRRRHRGFPLLCLSFALLAAAALLPGTAVAEGVTPSEARRLRDEVKDMFYHAFDGYMKYAFPLDELRPLSCQGEDSLGGYALTLIDSLDTLALLGDKEKFGAAVEWVGKNVRFDINKTVSVFETNIRILGGLLSAHLIASDYATPAGILARTSAGDVDPAIRTHAAFFSVWKKYGFTPEGFNLATSTVQNGQRSYPLRPELIESTYWLFKATRDYRYLDVGRDILASLQYGARCPCGYCHISDVETHKQDDHMESFFLAETVKYLWLLFDLAAGPDNIVENGPYKYIFSTEGHLLPVTPEIVLVDEHCSYFGAFCNGGADRGYGISASSMKHKKANYTHLDDIQTPSSHYSASNMFATRGYIKGVCPGLTHAQKLGISYSDEEGNVIEQTSEGHEHHDESAIESSVRTQSSNVILISHPVASQQDQALESSSGNGDHADIVVTADSDSISHDNNDGSLGANTEELTEDTERTSKHSEDEDIAQNLNLKEDIS